MPELPGVEVQRRNLSRWATDRRIAGVAGLDARVLERISPASFRAHLRGRAVRRIDETIAAEQADEIRYIEEAGAPNPFRIYRREGEPCPRCGVPIVRTELGGRATFHCPRCQATRS